MAPPVKKKKKFSSDNRRLISSTEIGEHEQQSMGSLTTSFGKRRSVRVSRKLNRPLWTKLKRWICTDIWMDTFPFFDHAQLGLKLALISPRFDVLVDKHFNCQSELTIWREITIVKDTGSELNLTVRIGGKSVQFPLPDRSLPNKIRFDNLNIDYIDHSVLVFLRANKQIWDKGTNLSLYVCWSHNQNDNNNNFLPIWDVFVCKIWPIFAPNIRRLSLSNSYHLDNFRRLISPTILTDLNLNSMCSGDLFPDGIGDDGPNATASQALSKWLHTPRKDGQPKRLVCYDYPSKNIEWVNNFKEAFLSATTSASYKIQLELHQSKPEPFELVNERTNEKLTMEEVPREVYNWVMKRCPNGGTEAAAQWEEEKTNNLNIVNFWLYNAENCIGPLCPPLAEERRSGAKQRKGFGRFSPTAILPLQSGPITQSKVVSAKKFFQIRALQTERRRMTYHSSNLVSWICTDVWMDIFPFFDRPQLGLKLALLSPRFDVLVDAHFDGKSELTIWSPIQIEQRFVLTAFQSKFEDFPMPERPLPRKTRFDHLLIEYIDYSVIAFLRSNKHVFDRGTKLYLHVPSFDYESPRRPSTEIEIMQRKWDIMSREILPIFVTNIRHLDIPDGGHLDHLRRLISPTILFDLINLNSMCSADLFPDVIADDGPNATAGQALSKWLHTPRKDGQPKRLCCKLHHVPVNEAKEWVNNFKKAFGQATASASSYQFELVSYKFIKAHFEPFELVNERTKERLTLREDGNYKVLITRCPIGGETAVWRQNENLADNFNSTVSFQLYACIGPLSAPFATDV